jgi:hypothetical protein
MDGRQEMRMPSSLHMAKIFYMGGGTHSRGMLRAILTMEQLNSVVPVDGVSYLGTEFPEGEFDAPVTVAEVSAEEAGKSATPWPTGFSRIHTAPADFDERLRFLPEPEKPSPKVARQNERRNGSALIHWLTRDMRSEA